MNDKYYVYMDYTNDFIPFYVGKGKLHRIKQKRRNKKHTNISNIYGFNREIIEVESEQAAFELEIKLIKDLKLNYCKNKDNHFACNFTYGGEGSSGREVSPTTRKKISEKLIENPIKLIGEKNPMYGKHHNEDSLRKMSEKLTGRKQSEDHKKNKAKALTGKKRSKEICDKMSETSKKTWADKKAKKELELQNELEIQYGHN
jgi:hypothetical protein